MELLTLSNGVRLVLEKMPYVRSASFGIWVRNGSANETPETNGISHFIEHMLFKGTDRRSARDIADEIDAVGGQINAYTTKEYTCYHTRTLDTHLGVAFDVLADMFFNSVFDDAEIRKERNVILEEISMYEDTPDELVHDLLQYNVWQGSPLGYPILGTESSISSLDSSAFKKYFTSNYRPQNTVISVAGNFDRDEVINKAEKYFSSYAAPEGTPGVNPPTVYIPHVSAVEKDIEQVHLVFGFPSLPIGTDDSYVLAVLNTIFGGGMSSRLFQKVREEYGLAYSVYCYNSSFTDTGLFGIYAGLNPAQTQQVIDVVTQEIRTLHTDRITGLQLERTKEQIKSNYVLGLENTSNIMSGLGRAQLMLKRVLSPEEILQKIDGVTMDDLYRIIDKVFDFDKMSLSAVGNLNGLNLREMLNSVR